MARLARVVLAGVPHHITQRGVRSMPIFQSDTDRLYYLKLLKANGAKHGVNFLAYCLMTNHVHLLAVPARPDSLSRAVGEAHKAYTRRMNLTSDVRGYLFQGRFFSCPLDERHTVAAALYTERNPVRAGMTDVPWDYTWSSAAFNSGLVKRNLLLNERGVNFKPQEWRQMLTRNQDNVPEMRRHFKSGRPLGEEAFIRQAEINSGRRLRLLLPGRKKGNRCCVPN